MQGLSACPDARASPSAEKQTLGNLYGFRVVVNSLPSLSSYVFLIHAVCAYMPTYTLGGSYSNRLCDYIGRRSQGRRKNQRPQARQTMTL